MTSTSSNSLEEELRRFHRRLITDIASHIDSRSGEGENFLFHIKHILGAGIYASHESVADKIAALEIKNTFGLENYEELKKICKDSGNDNLIDIIEKCEDNMKEVRSKDESTKEECMRVTKRKLSNNEIPASSNSEIPASSNSELPVPEQKEEIKRLRVEDSAEQNQDYEKAKAEWRTMMIQEYHNTVLKVPAMPLLPHEECEFSKVYVRPKIVSEVKDEKGKTKEIEIKSMSEIFTKNGVPLKSVYVVGDAGTGKSSFCKYLVNCWCMAHSEGQIVEDEFGGVNEMKKFDFLFLISLRHIQGIDSIHEMLKNQYDIGILDTLLEKESAKIIILLDGLDEWSYEGKAYNQFQTMGLPKRDVYKKYTIVTTSRPWKIHTLLIRDRDIQQMLKLKGFDDKSESEMIERTVANINSRRGESKDSYLCRWKLQEDSLTSLKQVPIMLQQLICLWFDGNLDKTSRCAVYTKMLELFFTWNYDKTEGTSSGNIEGFQTVELPENFADKEICELNSHIIYDMSRLAYETLFNCPKDKSLTFDISVFRKLKISDKIRESCLKLGILTNDRCPSLSVSARPKSMFSFIHKSVQEFLAAVNIAFNFKTKMNSLNTLESIDFQREFNQFVKEVFKNCSTLKGLLEQSNIFIMLCGLEPRLATHMSRYIYDIVKGDPLVQRYRRTVDSDIRFYYSSDYSCIRDIQNLIFDAMKECNASLTENRPIFYIGDLCIDDSNEYCDIICSSIDQQQIAPDSVLSINVVNINIKNVKFSKSLPKFKHLEKIKIHYEILGSSSTENVDPMIDEVNNSVAETIRINVSTLKSLSLWDTDKLVGKNIVPVLPSMINLVAIHMRVIKMSHNDTTSFCEFLKRNSHLEQIAIGITCECLNQHDVDLSKHQNLQYLDMDNSMCVTDIDTVNLEVFKCWNIKSTNYIKIFDSFGKCDKLKELVLHVDDDDQSFDTSITKRLVSVLPLLHNLSKLKLRGFRFTDNIIQVPSEMKSLKVIDLTDVSMSITTWRKFVDSLPSIPHTVDVELYGYYITGDGEEFNVDRLSLLIRGGEKMNEAIQYVKDQKHLFNVEHVDSFQFKFSTKKVK